MKRALWVLPIGFLAACTTNQLASREPSDSWKFNQDYQSVSQCLAQALNREWQPQSSASAIFGRSIGHHVVSVQPGKVNHVTHEHIGPGTAWMFVVTSAGNQTAIAAASALKNLSYNSTLQKMQRAANSCGGVTQ